jgi:hypothetical protein
MVDNELRLVGRGGHFLDRRAAVGEIPFAGLARAAVQIVQLGAHPPDGRGIGLAGELDDAAEAHALAEEAGAEQFGGGGPADRFGGIFDDAEPDRAVAEAAQVKHLAGPQIDIAAGTIADTVDQFVGLGVAQELNAIRMDRPQRDGAAGRVEADLGDAVAAHDGPAGQGLLELEGR